MNLRMTTFIFQTLSNLHSNMFKHHRRLTLSAVFEVTLITSVHAAHCFIYRCSVIVVAGSVAHLHCLKISLCVRPLHLFGLLFACFRLSAQTEETAKEYKTDKHWEVNVKQETADSPHSRVFLDRL